jgi:DNA-directed RNA polymerase specialized sigma24 family protein
MSASADVFESHRARLFGVAYRMLGSRNDAEDLLQDAYLRWHQSDRTNIQSLSCRPATGHPSRKTFAKPRL